MELDPQVLEQLEQLGGETLVERLFSLYLTHAPRRLERVRGALADGDLKEVASALHSLRSSSATLGAVALAKRLAQAEAAAERGVAAELGELWEPIEQEVETVLIDLRSRLRAL
jgi:HPt (histidine-containing phosphotransfer) domain-containing protein